jgi:uncharacterized protein
MAHYWIPALEVRPVPGIGLGVYTTEAIPEGTIVVAWGGEVVDRDTFFSMDEDRQTHSLQVADDLFLLAPDEMELADFVNHSCEPSTGLFGATMLIARRDIDAGEEITFDYAMCDSVDYDEFPCACGTASCRGIVSGADWRRPELWDRYEGRFSPYLQTRIERLRRSPASLETT